MRLRDVLELVRLPNVLTAPSDVAMGLALSGAALEPRSTLLFGASALAYAGGMALNDACDAELDARERPKRPIPSGRIGRMQAFVIAAVLLGGCVALAALAGTGSLVVALALVVAIVLYDARAKGTAIGPFAMASCRALDVGLGISAGTATMPAVCAAAFLFTYVAMLTVVSRFEVMRAPSLLVRGFAISVGMLLVVAAASLFLWFGSAGAIGMVPLAVLALWLARPVRAALADPAPERIIGVIKASVLGIILLDSAFVAGARGPLPGLLVAALLLPAWVLGRRFGSA